MAPIEQRYAEADEMAAWAASNPQRFAPIAIDIPDPRPPVRFIPSFLAASQSRSIARRRLMNPDEDGYRYVKLNLGCTEVEVGFTMLDGRPFIHGAIIHDGWVDIDFFAARTKEAWVADIDRELA